MSDDDNVPALWSQRYDLLHCADDPRLGTGRGLPASNAEFWLGKKCTDRVLEFLRRKITGRGSVIFPQAVDHGVSVKSERFGENIGAVSRLTLVASERAPHTARPGTGRHRSDTCLAPIVERPIGNRHIRVNPDIRMSYEEDS